MTKAIIIDNESQSASSLTSLLHRYCNDSVQLNSSFISMHEGIEGIKKHKPQLIFLDAGLHQSLGNNFMERETGNGCDLIFSSDSEQFAFYAFQP